MSVRLCSSSAYVPSTCRTLHAKIRMHPSIYHRHILMVKLHSLPPFSLPHSLQFVFMAIVDPASDPGYFNPPSTPVPLFASHVRTAPLSEFMDNYNGNVS